MRSFLLALIASLCALSVLTSCSSSNALTADQAQQQPKSNSAEDFLKWSMDRYHALKSFQAQAAWNASYGKYPGPGETRDLSYISPNIFQAKTSMFNSMKMTAVSDGEHMVEYAEGPMQQGMQYAAPESLARANSMMMGHPMFCGTLLYKFFGGSDDFDQLVDTSKAKVTFGEEATFPGGAKAKTVKFYAAGPMYGNTQVQIDEKTGTVYRIIYDSAPLLEQMNTMNLSEKLKDIPDKVKEKLKSQQIPTTSTTTETYSDIKLNPTLAKKDFVAEAPKGVTVAQNPMNGQDKPPFAVGAAVPDFQVISLRDNKRVSLHDFRGKVVMIDIWATWCGPCKLALPHNEALYKQFNGKDFALMAISDEEQDTIESFVKKSGYTLPFYRDPESKVGRQFQASAIPTTVIIDREGKLSSYLVGYREESDIRAALKKAGLP